MKKTFLKDSFKFQKKGKATQDISRVNIPLPKIFYLSLFINLLTISGTVALQRSLPPEVPLFYGLAEGEEQLSGKSGLGGLGVLSLVLTTFNLLLAILIKNEFLKKTLIVAGLSVSILTFNTISQIILLIVNF